jgi:hypothetical protein
MDFNLPGPTRGRSMDRLRRWSYQLDKAFRVPGTRIRFGWDSIIGLVPGMGDVVTALFSAMILAQAFRSRVPGVIKVRMLLNTFFDLTLGAIPVAGDLFDIVWKSHIRNFELLEKHGVRGAAAQTGDWVFVVGSIAIVAAVVLIPFLILAALISQLPAGLLQPPSGWQIL